MPKLGEYEWLPNIAFFVYPSSSDAALGRRVGGTGFLVAMPSKRWPDKIHHLYGVTNRHLADKCSAIRVNRHEGPPTILEVSEDSWHWVPNGYDVAVTPLEGRLDPKQHQAEALLCSSFFLTQSEVESLSINVAEDAFMVGRFTGFDGVETNVPSLRFGNLSILHAPWKQYGSESVLPCHVVDMRSRPGYSGSAVFVYRTAGSIFAKPNTVIGGGHLLKLLGVHSGQFPDEHPTSMTVVCPASAVVDTLGLPQLEQRREEWERSLCV